MSDKNIAFQVIDWNMIEQSSHPGKDGMALWQTLQLPGLRIRIVEYSAGYFADHWCQKGHIVHCLEGEFTTEQENGEKITLKKGMTYVVSDELSSHRSITENAVKLLIIDGDFLKYKQESQEEL
jgi:quercetin dioxygenase-like cupin family protein